VPPLEDLSEIIDQVKTWKFVQESKKDEVTLTEKTEVCIYFSITCTPSVSPPPPSPSPEGIVPCYVSLLIFPTRRQVHQKNKVLIRKPVRKHLVGFKKDFSTKKPKKGRLKMNRYLQYRQNRTNQTDLGFQRYREPWKPLHFYKIKVLKRRITSLL
jgi:hypothetical protein